MIEADNQEFLELLGDLFGAHSRNVKADIVGGYWRGLKHMTLGEFRAAVEADLEQLQHAPAGIARPPTVAEIWETHRSLKRKAIASTSSSDEPKYSGDDWSVTGNLLLLKHIVRLTRPRDLDYAPDGSTGQHTIAIAKILTRWMNAWVADMRESRQERTDLEGRGHWEHCMGEADRQVREYLERYVQRAVAA
jgi:hypothetical protein